MDKKPVGSAWRRWPKRFLDGHPKLHILECVTCGTVRACSDPRFIDLLRRAHGENCENGFHHNVASAVA